MKAKALSLLLLITVLCLLVPAFAKDMPDVPFGHWAYDAVDELTDLGVVEGYPDGTFKGDRTWTRYEFAVMLTRMIDFLEDYLDQKVAGMDMGITESAARAIAREEAQKAVAGMQLPDVQAFMNQVNSTATSAGAAAAREALAGYKPGISKAEAQAMIDAAVKNFVDKGALDAMAQEFRGELAMLGADVDDLMYRVSQLDTKFAALEARVTALENKPDKVTGQLTWRAGSAEEYYLRKLPDEVSGASTRGFFGGGWERFSNLDVKLNVDGFVAKDVAGHIQLWRPDATYDWNNRGTYVHEAWLDFDNDWLYPKHVRMGQQFHKSLLGLVFDNDLYPLESAKADFDFGAFDLTGMWGTIYDNNDTIGYGRLGWQVSSRFNLGATYVPNAVKSEERWGVDASFAKFKVPFFGLNADARFEYSELKEDIYGNKPTSENKGMLARVQLYSGDMDPGEACLALSWGEAQENFIPQLTSINPYNYNVIYSGLNWDYLLFNKVMPIAGSQVWSAEFTKSLGNTDVLLGWKQYNPWAASSFRLTPDSPFQTDNVNIYQIQLAHPLAEGVKATFTYGRADFDMVDDTRDYFSGSIDVVF